MARYTAIFEQAEDGSWGGYSPNLAAVLVNGSTLDEARENARTGLEFWMDDMKEQGLAVPRPSTHVQAFEVACVTLELSSDTGRSANGPVQTLPGVLGKVV